MVFSAEGQILIKVWPANSSDLNLVDYKSVSTATAFVTRIS